MMMKYIVKMHRTHCNTAVLGAWESTELWKTTFSHSVWFLLILLFKITIVLYPQNHKGGLPVQQSMSISTVWHMQSKPSGPQAQVHPEITEKGRWSRGSRRRTHVLTAIWTTNPSTNVHAKVMYKGTHEKAKQLLYSRKMQNPYLLTISLIQFN